MGKPIPQWKVDSDGTLFDPDLSQVVRKSLIHLIRNSLDHGIERPELRQKQGKPEHGMISLRVRSERGRIEMIYADDGAGLDLEGIRRKARQLELLGEQEDDPQALIACLFQEGFSTAAHISDISGRGVGMSAVKKYVEDVGGSLTIELESMERMLGRSRFQIRLRLGARSLSQDVA